MTLFTLLLVLAVERVTDKQISFDISTFCTRYFTFLSRQNLEKKLISKSSNVIVAWIFVLIIVFLPTLLACIVLDILPGFFVFFANIAILWSCIAHPKIKKIYKKYLKAANRDDLEACSLCAEQLGIEDGDINKMAEQVVWLNYYHYASVILFFIALGAPGVIFYSTCKAYLVYLSNINSTNKEIELSEPQRKLLVNTEKLMYVVDWLPVRITAFGFLLVGHFSKGLAVWLALASQAKVNAKTILAKVAVASEDSDYNYSVSQNTSQEVNHALSHSETLQMVKLVKRNIVFLLILVSVLTLFGVLS